jgi:hypothetical protein
MVRVWHLAYRILYSIIYLYRCFHTPFPGLNTFQTNWGSEFMADITFDILKTFGTISEERGGWKKELTLVSWNGRAPKYDIRDWSPDYEKMGKGLTLTKKEVETLMDLLKTALAEEDGEE